MTDAPKRRTPPSPPWRPGQSGNPAGRKPGSGKVAKLREAIAADLPEIIGSLVQQAKAGDVAAARLLVERVLPALKPVELAEPVALAGATLTEQGRAVITAAGDGHLAPGQAAQLLAGLGALSRLVEADELAARVAALEERAATDSRTGERGHGDIDQAHRRP